MNKLLCILLLLCVCEADAQNYRRAGRKAPVSGGGSTPYAFVSQVEDSKNAIGQTSIVSPAISVTAGNLLVAVAFYDYYSGTARTGTMASSPSNTWTEAGSGVFNGQYGFRVYYSYNSASGSTTLTWTPNTAVQYPGIYVAQFSGIKTASDPLTGTPSFGDQASPTTSTDAVTSGNTTPGGQPALIFGFAMECPGNGNAASGTGFTGLTAVWDYEGATPTTAKPEHKRVTSTSAIAATFTAAYNDAHLSVVVAFLEP
jgi:hypothetical protein